MNTGLDNLKVKMTLRFQLWGRKSCRHLSDTSRGFMSMLISGSVGYLCFVTLVTYRIWSRPGVVGMLYDWGIPGTRFGLERLLTTSWAAYNPVNLGSFSIFGQGPIWQWAPFLFSYLGVSSDAISRVILIAPFVISGLGAMTLGLLVFRRHAYHSQYAVVSAFLIGLLYVTSGEGFFVLSDGAVPLLWYFVFTPWVFCLAIWAASHEDMWWRLIPVGLVIGVAITILQMSWWFVPASLIVYTANTKKRARLGTHLLQALKRLALLLGTSLTVNLYWILHFGWVDFVAKPLVEATAGANSGLDNLASAPRAIEALGLTASSPGPSASLIQNSPFPIVTGLLPFLAIMIVISVALLSNIGRLERVSLLGFAIFAGLTAGDHIFGVVVRTIWSLTIMTPFRGFLHFEAIAASFCCILFAALVSSKSRRVRAGAFVFLLLALIGLGLPWVAGNLGGNGNQQLQGRLRTYSVLASDKRKLSALNDAGIGLLSIPTAGSVYFWSKSRNGSYGWRGGSQSTTIEYGALRELSNLSSANNGTPSEVQWFNYAPFRSSISSKELAQTMKSWDLGELVINKNEAAGLPQLNQYMPIPATEAIAKLKAPYFRPDGASKNSQYFRLVGFHKDWAQCVASCGTGTRILSSNPTSIITLAQPNSEIRVAQVNTGDLSVTCTGGQAKLNSPVGHEILIGTDCPSKTLVISEKSSRLDSLFDIVTVFGLAFWIGLLVRVRYRTKSKRFV